MDAEVTVRLRGLLPPTGEGRWPAWKQTQWQAGRSALSAFPLLLVLDRPPWSQPRDALWPLAWARLPAPLGRPELRPFLGPQAPGIWACPVWEDARSAEGVGWVWLGLDAFPGRAAGAPAAGAEPGTLAGDRLGGPGLEPPPPLPRWAKGRCAALAWEWRDGGAYWRLKEFGPLRRKGPHRAAPLLLP